MHLLLGCLSLFPSETRVTIDMIILVTHVLTDGNYIFVSHQLHRNSAGDREPEMMPDFSLRADREFWKVTQEGEERGICEKALWGWRRRSRSFSCHLQLLEFRNKLGLSP